MPQRQAERRRPSGTAFIFLDETGVLPSPRDQFFAVGMIKCGAPAEIQRRMRALRDKEHFYIEIKWSDVRARLLPTYKAALDCFFDVPTARFACFVADKAADDPIARFGSHWDAYEKLACQLLHGNIGPSELITVLADEYSTPLHIQFEARLQQDVNARLGGQHVIGVCRMRSTGVDVFQVLDLILGAVAYEHKITAGLVQPSGSPKAQVLDYIRRRFGVVSLLAPLRHPRINVARYGAVVKPPRRLRGPAIRQ